MLSTMAGHTIPPPPRMVWYGGTKSPPPGTAKQTNRPLNIAMSSEATAGQVPDIYDQVHPVETEDLVRNKLRAMQDEVAKLPESATTQLRNAQSNCPHLLTDDFRLMFLRCEVFNADVSMNVCVCVCACIGLAHAFTHPSLHTALCVCDRTRSLPPSDTLIIGKSGSRFVAPTRPFCPSPWLPTVLSWTTTWRLPLDSLPSCPDLPIVPAAGSCTCNPASKTGRNTRAKAWHGPYGIWCMPSCATRSTAPRPSNTALSFWRIPRYGCDLPVPPEIQ
jgi:hypothetical protein